LSKSVVSFHALVHSILAQAGAFSEHASALA
jgi:hypothetical protein